MAGAKRSDYREIKAIILGRLRDKIWAAGDMLPGEVELAAEFGCSRTTINRALRELADEGILDRRRKAGTRVKSLPVRQAKFAVQVIRDEIERTGAVYRYQLVDRQEVAAPDWLRARLDLPKQNRMLHLRCMHFADGRPFQFEDRWISLQTVPTARNEAFAQTGPNEWLISEVPLTNAELVFSATRLDAAQAEFLDAREGDASFVMERTTWLDCDPVTFARMVFRPGYSKTTSL